MTTFYSRYVPPKESLLMSQIHEQTTLKRKHDDIHQNHETAQQRRKAENTHLESAFTVNDLLVPTEKLQGRKAKKIRTSQKEGSLQADEGSPTEKGSVGKKVLEKYSLRSAAGNVNRARNPVHNTNDGEPGDLKIDNRATESAHFKKKAKTERNKTASTGAKENNVPERAGTVEPNVVGNQTHAKIRSKFEISKARVTAGSMPDNDRFQNQEDIEAIAPEDTKTNELHGLEPIPQPVQVDRPEELPTYSTLPRWIAKPLRVPTSKRTTFRDLNIDKQILSNLQARGLETAFAVQSAVIPLLSKGPSQYRGDLCISAATGSGKTLAYVLPMVEALKDLLGTKLRALIVVPTRELVNQVREVCEYCAAGTNLKIATSLGTKVLKDEQRVILDQHLVYDPEQYRLEQEQPVDWTKFGLEEILRSYEDAKTPNHVKRYTSKIDILICTPGRLVDHLRTTPGFSLDDIQRVVIDEADRLLNESFQEWVEVVMPALSSNAATRSRDNLLRELKLEVPERKIQKVVLSATMTQDISKLISLGLRNPKLVVVGDAQKSQTTQDGGNSDQNNEPLPDINGVFNLPSTLSESIIAVGDGSQKPLYLLKLLELCILNQVKTHVVSPRLDFKEGSSDQHEASDDESDSSSSESSPSTESDSSDVDSVSSSFSRPPASQSSNRLPAKQPIARNLNTALIFTRSTESASRLSRLLAHLSPNLSSTIGTLTKSNNSSSSRKTLSQFRQSKFTLLVATDRASRGLDLPNLAHVVSYDVPTSATAYVHRIGRTARAGQTGSAWTLVSHREARWFWNEIGKGTGETKISRNERVKRVNLEIDKDDDMTQKYEQALRKLGDEVRGDVA